MRDLDECIWVFTFLFGSLLILNLTGCGAKTDVNRTAHEILESVVEGELPGDHEELHLIIEVPGVVADIVVEENPFELSLSRDQSEHPLIEFAIKVPSVADADPERVFTTPESEEIESVGSLQIQISLLQLELKDKTSRLELRKEKLRTMKTKIKYLMKIADVYTRIFESVYSFELLPPDSDQAACGNFRDKTICVWERE